MKKWAKEFDFCILCKKTDFMHYGNGLCLVCGRKKYKNNRYKTDNIYRKKQLEYIKKGVSNWRKNNPDKYKAQAKVFISLRNGTLVKKPCFCGSEKVEAHHSNYLEPLNVEWLCKKHHVEADKDRKSN
jgi:hypothetical protein